MTRAFIACLTSITFSTAAFADEITLDQPLTGASLHEAGVDMSVYWVGSETGYNVIATYQGATETEASRIAMTLNEGDRVSFGLPAQRGIVYTFSRENDAVTVTGTRTGIDLAEG